MKILDEILEKHKSLYFPLYIKGKEYAGNDPHILNEINNLLMAGDIKKRFGTCDSSSETLDISDLQWNDDRLIYDKDEGYIYYDELARISYDTNDRTNLLMNENNEKLSEKEVKQ